MRTRTKEIKIRLNEKEQEQLNKQIEKSIFNREEFIRMRIAGYEIRENPGVEISQFISSYSSSSPGCSKILMRSETSKYTTFYGRYHHRYYSSQRNLCSFRIYCLLFQKDNLLNNKLFCSYCHLIYSKLSMGESFEFTPAAFSQTSR